MEENKIETSQSQSMNGSKVALEDLNGKLN